MRVLLAVLITVSSVEAYDAVVFSNEQKITDKYPSIANLLSTASSESPLVFIVNPDFTLGQFSREVNAYSQEKQVSGLPALVKSASYYASRYLADKIHAPGAVILTSPDNFVPGAHIYILVGKEWASMESLANTLLPLMKNKYTAVITASEAVSEDKVRIKRVVTSDMENESPQPESSSLGAAGGPDIVMPLNLPPYNRTEYSDVKPGSPGLGSCMLYMEGINIVVQSNKKSFATIPIRSNETTWSYADGDVKCANDTVGEYRFAVRLKLNKDVSDDKKQVKISSGSQVMFTLVFTGAKTGFWQLSDVIANKLFVEPDSGATFLSGKATAEEKVIPQSVQNVGITSVQGFAFACSDSQAAFFKTDQENVIIGISLSNTEIQPFAVFPDKKTQQVYFTAQVDDCTGTFSVGSWMGIVSSLILLAGFFFGFLMLNSVQTMDRFDDPKHKQIVINVRE